MHRTREGVLSDSDEPNWTRRMLAEHPALLMSGLYLIASLIGLVYSWAFLGAFGINAFRYSEISDFLLASLKEPFTWILAAFAIALVFVDNALSQLVQAKRPGWLFRWYGSERYRQMNYLVAVGLVSIFLFEYAAWQEEKIRNGDGDIVSVHLADASPPKQLTLLGTTGKFVFLYDPDAERVDIHPHESILMITKPAPVKRAK
jgi:hypothetical protein